jgi:Tol biopolymer transport system component
MSAMRARNILIGGLLCAAGLLPAASAHAAGDRIAYTCGQDICTVDPDLPATAVNLTNTTIFTELAPVWSPDGTHLAFTANYPPPGMTDPGYNDVFTTDSAGATTAINVTQTPDRPEAQPVWSPDGTRIAMEAEYPNTGHSDVFISPADGASAPLAIGSTSTFDESYPTWSPDGTRIAFARGSGQIVVGNADGSDTPTAVGVGLQPSWSPDGTRIAALLPQTQTQPNIVRVLKLNDSSFVDLATPSSDADTPTWSPDSTRVAYTDNGTSGNSGNNHVIVARADGTGTPVTITAPAIVLHNPTWSPDGTRIAFDAYPNPAPSPLYRQIYVAPADGSAPAVAITNSATDNSAPVWKPAPPSTGGGSPGGGTPGGGTGTPPGGGTGTNPGTPVLPIIKLPTPTRPVVTVQFASFRTPVVTNGFMNAVFVSCSFGATANAVKAGCTFGGTGSTLAVPIGKTATAAAAKKKAHTIVFATGSVKVSSGKKKALPLKLTKAGRKLAKPGKTLKIKVTVKESRSGHVVSTKIKTLTLKIPRARSHKH